MGNSSVLGKTFAQEITFKKRESKISGSFGLVAVIVFSFSVVILAALVFSYLANYLQVQPTFAATDIEKQQVTEIITIGYVSCQRVDSSQIINQALGEDWQLTNPTAINDKSVQRRTTKVKSVSFASRPYQARRVAQSYPSINIEAGRGITFWVEYENLGTVTWENSGLHFIALNVTNPTGRPSPFRHQFWIEYYRPCHLSQSQVKAGETGRFRFALQAPGREGYYTECFGLVAENLTWIPGGDFCLDIKVGNPVPDFSAKKLRQSEDSLVLQAGEQGDFWVDFENRGKVTWRNDGDHFIALNVTNPAGRHSDFQDASWTEYYYRPTRMLQTEVKRSDVGRFNFSLTAPEVAGNYLECFGLVAENLTWISGGDFCLEIQVQAEEAEISSLGPDLRVGLFSTEEPLDLTASTDFQVLTSENELVANFQAGQEISLKYQGSKYQVYHQGQKLHQSTEYLRVVSDDDGIITLTNYNDAPDYNEKLVDNQFYGQIELRYAEETEKLWVINELPMEYYLRGLAETGNTSPAEYQKALIIAARTYALYHYNHNTKHAEDNFHVDDQYDQVYRGYGFKQRTPNLTESVIATTGQIVTYNGELAITPYFSHSDGRTRSWEEVWAGGPYPWLVSVPDPHCEGMDLLGHGVGMSALGALLMADEDDASYDQILKHYYTGIDIEKIY